MHIAALSVASGGPCHSVTSSGIGAFVAFDSHSPMAKTAEGRQSTQGGWDNLHYLHVSPSYRAAPSQGAKLRTSH